jgi:hypothetical protein
MAYATISRKETRMSKLHDALKGLFISQGYSENDAARMADASTGANPVADWLGDAKQPAAEAAPTAKLAEGAATPGRIPTLQELIAAAERRRKLGITVKPRSASKGKRKATTERAVNLQEDSAAFDVVIDERGENANVGRIVKGAR